MLSAVPIRPPWDLLGAAIQDPASAFKFELYDLKHDWTQYTDVAAANPVKLQEMKDLMFAEFGKYQVLTHDRLRLQVRRARLRNAGVQQHQWHRPLGHRNAVGRRKSGRDA